MKRRGGGGVASNGIYRTPMAPVSSDMMAAKLRTAAATLSGGAVWRIC